MMPNVILKNALCHSSGALLFHWIHIDITSEIIIIRTNTYRNPSAVAGSSVTVYLRQLSEMDGLLAWTAKVLSHVKWGSLTVDMADTHYSTYIYIT